MRFGSAVEQVFIGDSARKGKEASEVVFTDNALGYTNSKESSIAIHPSTTAAGRAKGAISQEARMPTRPKGEDYYTSPRLLNSCEN